MVFNTGTIVTVTDPVTKKVLLDLESDRLCVWTKGNAQELFGKLRAPQGETTRALEFYLSGHVELAISRRTRMRSFAPTSFTMTSTATLPSPFARTWKSSSRLPFIRFTSRRMNWSNSMPSCFGQADGNLFDGIAIRSRLEDFGARSQDRGVRYRSEVNFGITVLDRKTGKPMEYQQHVFSGESNVIRLEGVPIFYFPYLKANVERPLGPLDAINANYNRSLVFN